MGFPRHMEAVVYEPVEPDERASVAIMVMHSDANYYQFIPCPELAKRGFYVMVANTSNQKQPLEKKLQELAVYVEYLRGLPGIQKVVLLGHSGGATLMSCYQAVAENGVKIFQDDKKLVKIPDIGPLPKADAVMFLDSNWGNGVMTLLSIDPQVTDEATTKNLNTEFDLFDPANGFDPEGSHYAPEFVAKYQKAQAERFDRIVEHAMERYHALENGEGDYIDDEPFIVPAGAQPAPNNRLFPQDIRYLCHTKEEYPLIHADGSITTEVIRSLRPAKFTKSFSRIFGMGTEVSTVRTYVSSSCVKTMDFNYDDAEIKGVDWDSSYCCTPGNVQYIGAPMLIMGMTGGYEFLAAEVIYKQAKSADKTIAFVEGATHNFEPEKATEKFPGQYGDTVANCFDYVAKWLVEKEL
ncbi:MAG: alpha/beta hydrolase [Lachnospiraceae bacterium]|nr:alpha/beta hydrolase [Lachnospiraceae bacterium]